MITTIHWGAPEYFWLFPFVLGSIGLIVYRLHMRQHAVALLGGKWSHVVIKNHEPGKQKIRALLLSLGVLFLWLALLRPQWSKREKIIMQEGRDLVIALDISRSMLAQDCTPNRLDHAKIKIKRLLNLLECERVSLMLFSGSAFMQCPLTTDYAAFLMHLDHVDVETISSGSTSIESAMRNALDMYKEMSNKKTKLLVLLTDGEDFSPNLKSYKERAKKEGLHIFTLGLGSQEGAPIPLYDEKGQQVGHQKDARGSIVISQRNDTLLHALSQDVGGTYFPVTQDNEDIKKLVRHITRFEKEKFDDTKITQHEDKYHYFLLISFICFILEWLV